MLALEELLQPVAAAAESGQNLRYDPVFDNIREALSEDDGALPMGSWVRQAKRADYSLVVSLAEDALRKRSKDLWLAAWLGEAMIQLEGSGALEPSLRLILDLQQRFWSSLHPEIDDGDVSMRAAPVQWGLDRFATLLEKFSITEDGLPYSAYKAVRAGITWSESTESLNIESIDDALQSTPIEFYAAIEVKLTQALTTLAELQQFCDEHYKDDGPSFAVLRDALQELHGLAARQLRLRPAPKAEDSPLAEVDCAPATVPIGDEQPEIDSPAQQQSEFTLNPAKQRGEATHDRDPESPLSWEDAMNRVAGCAFYLLEQRPENPACYLLATALHYGRDASTFPAFPLSETRLGLKRAFNNENWNALLAQAVRAMLEDGGPRWLDSHRYAWQAAAHLGANYLQALIGVVVSARLAEHSTWPGESFDDDTPVANPETQRWLESVLASRDVPPTAEMEPIPLSRQPPSESNDISTSAKALAEQGEIEQALGLLMEAVSSAQTGRDKFLLRMEICRVCLVAGKKLLAANILRQMLSESDGLRLEQWEGRGQSGPLLAMLLKATDGDETDAEERRSLYARLCAVDPARAFVASTFR